MLYGVVQGELEWVGCPVSGKGHAILFRFASIVIFISESCGVSKTSSRSFLWFGSILSGAGVADQGVQSSGREGYNSLAFSSNITAEISTFSASLPV